MKPLIRILNKFLFRVLMRLKRRRWRQEKERRREVDFINKLDKFKNNFSSASPPPLKKGRKWLNTDDGKVYEYDGREWHEKTG